MFNRLTSFASQTLARNAALAEQTGYHGFHPTRRTFIADAAQSLLGVGCAAALQSSSRGSLAYAAEAAGDAGQAVGKAKSVIFLFMNGAMSHLDTLDPKEGTTSQGETLSVSSRLPGVSLSAKLPKLAYLMNGITLVRSMTTETGAHAQGTYIMRTSYKPLNSIQHPGLGAWAGHLLKKSNRNLPGNVLIGSATGHPAAGFLSASLAPVPVTNPAAGLENTQSPSYLSQEQFRQRMSLARQFDAKFKAQYQSQLIEAYDQTYREAVQLMGSSELKAFDISQEKAEVRELYGHNRLGQGCLLARRLVESGVRFVEIDYGNWDHHSDIYKHLPDMTTQLDNALGALLRDLASKQMLGEVLVVLSTEFGRSPQINENAGRDHHPAVFSSLLCGAGIQGGGVYGQSDELGQAVEQDAVTHQDMNATIATALGLPLEQEFIAPNGRPFRICDDGVPLKKLLV